MDLSAEVEKLTCETAALRNEIWELKELVNRQNERIIYMLTRQNDMLTGIVGGKKTATEIVALQEATINPIEHAKIQIKEESPQIAKSSKIIKSSSKVKIKSNKHKLKVPKVEKTSESDAEFLACSDSEDSKDFALESCFPLDTQEDLDNLETEINSINKEQLIDAVKVQIRPEGLIKNLIKVMSLGLVMEYNLDGRQNKKRLQDYPKLLDVLYRASKRENYTRDMFTDELRRALKVVKNSYHKRQCVMNKKKREMAELQDIFF